MGYLYLKGMANIVDRVFAEVCLDERISDGIFRMEEEEHMNALRDYFVKRGIAKEAATHVTNQMVEGRFPERQAYNADGILVTFPTPKHKADAIKRGTHFEENPAPQNSPPPKEEPKRPDLKPTDKVPDETPAPEAKPAESPLVNKVAANGIEFDVEPPRGSEKPEDLPQPPEPPKQPATPKTPERTAAEKEVIKQILATDDTALSPVSPMDGNLNEELLLHQLTALSRKCDEWAMRDAEKFLKPHIDRLKKVYE